MPGKPRVVAVVQARMGSTRLPGKVLMDVGGRAMLGRVLDRASRAPSLDVVVVATTGSEADDPICDWCAAEGYGFHRGSETDVLDRYYQAAKAQGADVVVRITADCPLLDPSVVDKVVRVYLDGGLDYVSNTLRYTYPDGLDTEVFSFEALERAWKEARQPAEREHVTPFLKDAGRFRIRNVESPEDLSARDLRWTVDDPGDLEFVRAVYGRLGRGDGFGMEDVLALLAKEPALEELNMGTVRNEGYYKSLAAEPAMKPLERSLAKSLAWKRKAEALIPSCTQTFSKGYNQFVQGVAPIFLEEGTGCRVKDVDGNEYVDYILGLGPVILGYGYPRVNQAVERQLKKGVSYSLPHPLEVEVAELIVDMVPCAEMVRFGKNGSDVTAGAIRIARAHTGREHVACCGYHGWQDWYIGSTTRNLGVPASTQALIHHFNYNDPASLEKLFAEHPGRIAAVILEPIGAIPPAEGFLGKVKDIARRNGALLVFDEVITGFRLAPGGAQEYFGVTPDLACFGKALANGFPLAAIAGPRDLMALMDRIFFSFTFGGEALSLCAAKATLEEMREKNVIGHLREQGGRLADGFKILSAHYGLSDRLFLQGLPARTVASFKDPSGADSLIVKSLFQQECLKRGVLQLGFHNICFSHGPEDIDYTLRVYRAAMEVVAAAMRDGDIGKFLEGEAVQPVFRKP